MSEGSSRVPADLRYAPADREGLSELTWGRESDEHVILLVEQLVDLRLDASLGRDREELLQRLLCRRHLPRVQEARAA